MQRGRLTDSEKEVTRHSLGFAAAVNTPTYARSTRTACQAAYAVVLGSSIRRLWRQKPGYEGRCLGTADGTLDSCYKLWLGSLRNRPHDLLEY